MPKFNNIGDAIDAINNLKPAEAIAIFTDPNYESSAKRLLRHHSELTDIDFYDSTENLQGQEARATRRVNFVKLSQCGHAGAAVARELLNSHDFFNKLFPAPYAKAEFEAWTKTLPNDRSLVELAIISAGVDNGMRMPLPEDADPGLMAYLLKP